jgi:hypothetical protein
LRTCLIFKARKRGCEMYKDYYGDGEKVTIKITVNVRDRSDRKIRTTHFLEHKERVLKKLADQILDLSAEDKDSEDEVIVNVSSVEI